MRTRENSNPFAIAGSERFYGYSVKNKARGKWLEVDLFADKKNSDRNSSLGLLIDQKLITAWLAVILVGILILIGRAAYLQLFQGEYFSAVAEGNRIRVMDIKASRGVIYDRHQNLLVENVPGFSLAVIPVDLTNDEAEFRLLADELAKISAKSAEEIYQLISGQLPYSYQPVIIQENLTQGQAILVNILSSRFPGVVLRTVSTRNYLDASDHFSLSHILGYEGKIEENKLKEYLNYGYSIDDYVGKAGIELFYETQLKGINGREQVEVDATGVAKEIIASQKPVSGQNLVLTVDLELQQQAERSLRRTLSAFGKDKGAVIVLDPNSGEILAMVNWPAFDNNLFSRGISAEDFSSLINDPDQPLFTRAVSGEYPSGSTFKLVVAAAALQEGLITPSTGFNSVGGIRVSSWFFPDWKAGGHGWTTIVKALAESVNTFFYIIGGGLDDFEGLGVEKMREYAEKFGLNKKLGIDLSNEAGGFFPSIEWKNKTKGEQWYIGDTYHVAIGQGDILVTPLQVAGWTSVFANGGTLFQPHLVKEILDKDNNVISQMEPKILNQDFIDSENIQTVNRGLRQAVLTGSAQGLSGLPIAAAAKTGTAEWSSQKPPHAWLTTFAPYENPQIVVTVLIEEGGEGSTVALPVAREIISWWAENR